MTHEFIKNIAGNVFHNMADLQKWDPQYCGEIDIRIDHSGRWFHEGAAFERTSIVKLFSKILRKENNAYYLVTPFEKWKIQVEDAPFFISDYHRIGDVIEFITSLGDHVRLTPDNPIFFKVQPDGGRRPYIYVRDNLASVIGRNTYYGLAEQASLKNGKYGITSGGYFFLLE